MSRAVEFHELARADLYEAWSWYEERQRGLGDRFVDAVDAALVGVVEWPGSGSPAIEHEGEVVERTVRPTGFPYLARYRITEQTVLVTAIYHHRRRPGFGFERPI